MISRSWHWSVAPKIETFDNKHGVVRTVRLKLGSENNTQRELVQPIAKIVLLVEGDSPTESQGEGSQMKRVRDNFSHMRPLKYICHCV